MKLLLTLLLSLLLSGCAPQPDAPESTAPTQAAAVPMETAPQASLILGSQAEGSLRTYQLETTLNGLLPLGEELLLFSGEETARLWLLDPLSMTVKATHDPGFLLLPQNATVQRLDQGLAYFHADTRETIVLDGSLREVRRIPAPADLMGLPLLSADGQTLFYCTASAIRALDLDSGISRILKEASYPVQGLSGLLLDDRVLQVSITDESNQWRTLFLSAQTGQLLKDCGGNVLPQTGSDFYFLNSDPTLLFGRPEGPAAVLNPLRPAADCFFLADSRRALTAGADGTAWDLYDLETGARRAELLPDRPHHLQSVTETADGRIWVLCYDEAALHCWDPAVSAVSDQGYYAVDHYTRSQPDYDGLAACTLYAQELSQKHGVEILVYKDAAAVEPWDYHLEYEHQAGVLQRELEALDARLSRLPEGFLDTIAEKYTRLTISLVRSAQGSPESGSLEAVNGLQFLVDFDAYIVLATDHDTEDALYHELCHLMETVVLTRSSIYDRWENLNPDDFRYDTQYASDPSLDVSPWMKEGREYFIDTYSMSHPREDRARIFEYAMTAGHEDLFASTHLQNKLRRMCQAIQESFDLEDAASPLPWEQYLAEG